MDYGQLKHWIKENTQGEDVTGILLESELESHKQLAWRIRGARELGDEILKRWPEDK